VPHYTKKGLFMTLNISNSEPNYKHKSQNNSHSCIPNTCSNKNGSESSNGFQCEFCIDEKNSPEGLARNQLNGYLKIP